MIGGITRILQDFIAIVNTLEQSIGQFIDPLLNEIVDIANTIKNIAGQIGGIVKQIINSIRDGIIKCLISLFKSFGITETNQSSTLTYRTSCTKSNKNSITTNFWFLKINWCNDRFWIKMLENMINGVINPTICAAEQAVSGILAKLMSLIEELLEPILSGVQWLTGGLGTISGILNQASTLATEIYNFIGCDEIKCNKPSEWISSTSAALQRGSDDWTKQLEGVNVLKGISKDLTTISSGISTGGLDGYDYNGSNLSGLNKIAKGLGGNLSSIEGAIASISLFGSNNSSFGECNEKTSNPQTQYDLSPVPFGYKYSYCIPPIAVAFGSTNAAQLTPIVSTNGSIFDVVVCAGGTGYSSPLSIAIIDNSGYGQGAQVDAIIGAGGSITGAIVISGGSGYCPGIIIIYVQK